MLRYCYLLSLAFTYTTLSAQSTGPWFEVISEDSVRLYVNQSRTSFTGKDCSGGYRLTRLSADGNFEGKFKDYQAGNHLNPLAHLLVEGAYREGKKEGKYTFYNTSGKAIIEGVFSNNLPSGDWKFYDSGTLLLVLQFVGKPLPSIHYVFDAATQRVLVKDGEGEARFVVEAEYPFSVSGKVKAGQPDGLWIGESASDGNETKRVRKETYRAGVMVEGKKIQSGRITDVCCTPELPKIFPTAEISGMLDLETFPFEVCVHQFIEPTGDAPTVRSAVPVSGLNNFRSSVKEIIRAKYSGRDVGEGFNPISLGTEENKVVIEFNTDENGRPVHTRLASGYGREFFMPIRRALQTQMTFEPNQTKLLLTVLVQATPNIFRYQIDFSF